MIRILLFSSFVSAAAGAIGWIYVWRAPRGRGGQVHWDHIVAGLLGVVLFGLAVALVVSAAVVGMMDQ